MDKAARSILPISRSQRVSPRSAATVSQSVYRRGIYGIARTLLVFFVITFSSCRSLFLNPDALHLMHAEEFSRQKNYDEAIEEYRKHMEYRLSLTDRPEWENPYFYLILIGDLLLVESKPEEALKTINEAERMQVDSNLISDRYRSLAHWYEDKGQLEQAVKILKLRKDKDPILIDSMLDRLSKEIVRAEEASAAR